MARLLRDSCLESREARFRLKARKEPYWKLISEGIHLGYYRGNRGGMWHIRARTADGQKYVKAGLGKADDFAYADGEITLSFSQAQEQARKFADVVLRGEERDTKPYTVETAIEEYLADFKTSGKKSYYTTKTQINAHIRPTFGDDIVSALTFKKLNAWKNKLANSDKRARTAIGEKQQYNRNTNDDPDYQRKRRATSNRTITTLKAILNHAFKTDRIKSNEAWQKLKPFKNVSEPKIRFLDEKTSLKLINACEPSFRLLVLGALLTGARYGELTTLRVSDYTEKQTIYIHQSKSGKPRHIPLNKEGINFFDQLITGKQLDEFVFTRTNNSPWKKTIKLGHSLPHALLQRSSTPLLSMTYGILMPALSLCVVFDCKLLQQCLGILILASPINITHTLYHHISLMLFEHISLILGKLK